MQTDVDGAQVVEGWRRRRVVYLVGAMLVVVAVVVWVQLTSQPMDPAEADGDPDGGALELIAIVVASGLALALYAIVVGVVEWVMRWTAARRRRIG